MNILIFLKTPGYLEDISDCEDANLNYSAKKEIARGALGRRRCCYTSPSPTGSGLSLVIKTIIDLYCGQYTDYNQHQRTVIKVKNFK